MNVSFDQSGFGAHARLGIHVPLALVVLRFDLLALELVFEVYDAVFHHLVRGGGLRQRDLQFLMV